MSNSLAIILTKPNSMSYLTEDTDIFQPTQEVKWKQEEKTASYKLSSSLIQTSSTVFLSSVSHNVSLETVLDINIGIYTNKGYFVDSSLSKLINDNITDLFE